MFETIMRERRRREVEPIIVTIDRCCESVDQAAAPHSPDEAEDAREMRRRLESLRHFLSTMGLLFDLLLRFGPRGLEKMAGQWTVGQTSSGSAKGGTSPAGRKRGRRTASTTT